jgi:hypothetical protein
MSLLLPLRILRTVWIRDSMVTHGAIPSLTISTIIKVSLLETPPVLANWFVTTRIVTSYLDHHWNETK